VICDKEEEAEEEEKRRRRSRDTQSKTRTPHKDVGKKGSVKQFTWHW